MLVSRNPSDIICYPVILVPVVSFDEMPGDSVIVTRVNVLSTGKAGAGSSSVPGRPLLQWSRVWSEAPPPISVGARTLTLVARSREWQCQCIRGYIAADTLVIIAGVAIKLLY